MSVDQTEPFKAQKAGVIIEVAKFSYEEDAQMLDYIKMRAREQISELGAIVVDTITSSVKELDPLDSASYDSKGNLRQYVRIMFSAYIIPKDAQPMPPCVHCGHLCSSHKRHDASPDVAVYAPCTACNCKGYSDNDPEETDDADI